MSLRYPDTAAPFKFGLVERSADCYSLKFLHPRIGKALSVLSCCFPGAYIGGAFWKWWGTWFFQQFICRWDRIGAVGAVGHPNFPQWKLLLNICDINKSNRRIEEWPKIYLNDLLLLNFGSLGMWVTIGLKVKIPWPVVFLAAAVWPTNTNTVLESENLLSWNGYNSWTEWKYVYEQQFRPSQRTHNINGLNTALSFVHSVIV